MGKGILAQSISVGKGDTMTSEAQVKRDLDIVKRAIGAKREGYDPMRGKLLVKLLKEYEEELENMTVAEHHEQAKDVVRAFIKKGQWDPHKFDLSEYSEE